MPTGGQIGSGIRIGYRTGSPGTWVPITAILEGDPPQFTRDRVETTVHGVTGDRTYIPGLRDVSDIRALLLADLQRSTSPSHLALSDFEISQAIIWLRYEVPITSTLSTTNFYVYELQVRVSSFKVIPPIDGRKEIEVMFQYAGGGIAVYENIASVL